MSGNPTFVIASFLVVFLQKVAVFLLSQHSDLLNIFGEKGGGHRSNGLK